MGLEKTYAYQKKNPTGTRGENSEFAPTRSSLKEIAQRVAQVAKRLRQLQRFPARPAYKIDDIQRDLTLLRLEGITVSHLESQIPELKAKVAIAQLEKGLRAQAKKRKRVRERD